MHKREILFITTSTAHRVLITIIDAFPGSPGVEAIDTSQHRPIYRRDDRPLPNCLAVDAPRKLDGVHQIEPAPRSGLSCEGFFVPPYRLPQLS